MEFILINESKLKVMLDKSDLEEFDISAERLDYSNTETKRMFWDIIGRAKKNVGFECDGVRVLVQLYTSKDGSCELFVSKVGRTLGEKDYAPSLCFKPSHKASHDTSRTGAFKFDSLEWLLSVCRRLNGIGYSGSSDVYIDDDRCFYLFLDGLDATGYIFLDEYSFINEYGSPQNTEATLSFLSEHGRIICKDDAVNKLSTI